MFTVYTLEIWFFSIVVYIQKWHWAFLMQKKIKVKAHIKLKNDNIFHFIAQIRVHMKFAYILFNLNWKIFRHRTKYITYILSFKLSPLWTEEKVVSPQFYFLWYSGSSSCIPVPPKETHITEHWFSFEFW